MNGIGKKKTLNNIPHLDLMVNYERANRLDLSYWITVVISICFIIFLLPAAVRRGPVGIVSALFYSAIASLAVQGVVVLWHYRNNFRTWYRTVVKWTAIVTCILSALLTLAYATNGITINLGAIWVRSIEHMIDGGSIWGGITLFLVLWAYLMAFAWLFVAAISGGTWVSVKIQQRLLPKMLMDLKNLNFDGKDSWPRRLMAWSMSFPSVLEPSTLTIETPHMDERTNGQRLYRAVAWQMAIGALIGLYVALNPTLLALMPFAQTYALVSIPVGLIPLLILPLLTLEALGVKVTGPRKDFYLHLGAKKRVLQAVLALGGLFWVVLWAVSKIGMTRIVVTFAGYSLLLFLFSMLATYIYLHLFEAGLIDVLRTRLKEEGF